MSKDKYIQVRDNLIFTFHGKDNIMGTRTDNQNRTDIPLHMIVSCICYGIAGFAGSKRFKKTLRNLEVIYKLDKETDPDNVKYVVITYYRVNKKKYLNPVDRILAENNLK